MERLSVKDIIVCLSLLVLSRWLLSQAGRLEEVVEKFGRLLMTLFSDVFFMRRKDIRQLFSPTTYMAIRYLKNWPFALATSLLFCFLTK